MTKINVIGDIHGRRNWKELVKEDEVNVFLGDYFDPYDRFTADQLVENFLEIITFKEKHPETVLLYGNHDHHYIVPAYGGSTSRYNSRMAKRFKELFSEFNGLFKGVAYAPDSKHLITHAGVTKDWLDKYLDTDDFTGIWLPDGSKVPTTVEMERFVNGLWSDSKETEGHHEKCEFSFQENCDIWDTYGDTPTQSPIWVRPNTLANYNAYKGTDVVQIVGHTQVERIADLSGEEKTKSGKTVRIGLVLTDCLGNTTESYSFNTEEI